ncbi:MAG: FAD-binding oxidoreductase [Dehalococcoidia bacterium]|nr:FAD-binding oxidoreductase [Dehalococcoidia bacterium]MDH4299675.1 FAD-binding oxidoreductase [Dehalococcoidia bacterium]MDH4366517.1 FAD-binding oxidoreductase [Dehalococcoidia bacterium]
MKVKTYMSQKGILPRGFIARVRQIVGNEHFSQQEGDLISYSLDYWLYGVFLSQKGDLPALPSAVISPASAAQIQEIVRCAGQYKVPITPFGGGSGVLGGAIPLNGSVVLNLQRMSKFLNLDELSLVAEFEAGIMGANLELELNHLGYSAGNIPQSLYCSTLGGWISTRAAGQFSTKYGKIEDMVLGMEVVLPDGNLLNIRPVPRRSVGPSLKDLFLGGEGTLGIVTRATISIHPLPRLTIKQSFIFPSIEVAVEVVRQVLRAEARPAVVRIFDEAESGRYFPNIGRKVVTIFISEGETEYTNVDARVIRRISRQNGGKSSGEEPANIWLQKRFDIGLGPVLMQYGGIVDTIEVSALFKDAVGLYRDMVAGMKAVEGTLEVSGHYSHFYREGACLYITFAGIPKDPLRYYQDTWDAAMKATLQNNGSISHHHGIGFWRIQYLEQELGASGVRLLKSIKSALDPEGILNRGKLVDGGR